MGAQSVREAKVRLLGAFSVHYAGEPIAPSAWKRRRPVDLLTSLALAPGHVMHREEIIDRLWPDKDLEAGSNNLYRTLHDLRRITGDDIVVVERGAVRLGEHTWVDVTAFEKAAAAPALERWLEALRLYRGDLLPDNPYSEFLDARREGLRQRFVDTALRLARHEDLTEDTRIDVLRRLVQVDPTIEEAQQLLMRALAHAGRPREAMRQFQVFVEALNKHLDARPSSATLELQRTISQGELFSTTTSAPREDNWKHVARRLIGTDAPRPIRGRSVVLEQARAFAKEGRGTMFILGEAGAGKTRIALECSRLCAESGAIILAGLGCDFEGTAPYTPFVDAWADVVRIRPDVADPFLSFTPTPGGSAQDDRLRFFKSVEQSIQAIAGSQHTCILIEDLHQADESSLHLFHHLARAARRLPIQVIGTLREEEARPGSSLHALMVSLGRERSTRRLKLERLDIHATAELIRDLWGEMPQMSVAEAVHGLAGGNPFYTEEIATVLREAPEGSAFAPSVDLMQTVRDRIARIGRASESLLMAASVQGVRFDFDIARAAAEVEQARALDALDMALGARLIDEQDHGVYRFRHALLREAVYESLSSARRAFFHDRTAAAYESRRESSFAGPEVLAYHHLQAGDIAAALPYELLAIERAQARLGFGEAVDHTERALDHMDALGESASERRFGLLRDMGAMRVALGELDRAVMNLEQAAGIASETWSPTASQRCNALRLAGLALIEAGSLGLAEACLDRALQALGDIEDHEELCNVYYLYAQLRWHQSRHEEAFALAEKCLHVAEAIGDAGAIAKGYEMLALACHSLGEWKKGRDYEEQRTAVTDGTLDVASAFDVHL